MPIRILIVGQGLAGTLLGSALEDIHIDFIIIDEDRPHAASRRAAGLIHPISGRRFVKSWKYDELEREFRSCYEAIGQKLKCTVLHPHNVLLSLTSTKEENDLLSQAHRYDFAGLIHRLYPKPEILTSTIKEVYSIQSYRLDMLSLLDGFRAKWKSEGKLRSSTLNYELLIRKQTEWQYDGDVFSHVVFCEGASVLQNPFFKSLPIVPNKGQLIWIESEDWTLEDTIKHQLIISGYRQRQWVGATYEWSFEHAYPTKSGLHDLQSKLHQIIKAPYRVIDHQAGIRPTVRDRRPILAKHPDLPDMWAINGFGTKGGSLGPYIIKQWVELLHHEDHVNEFGTDRFF